MHLNGFLANERERQKDRKREREWYSERERGTEKERERGRERERERDRERHRERERERVRKWEPNYQMKKKAKTTGIENELNAESLQQTNLKLLEVVHFISTLVLLSYLWQVHRQLQQPPII